MQRVICFNNKFNKKGAPKRCTCKDDAEFNEAFEKWEHPTLIKEESKRLDSSRKQKEDIGENEKCHTQN